MPGTRYKLFGQVTDCETEKTELNRKFIEVKTGDLTTCGVRIYTATDSRPE